MFVAVDQPLAIIAEGDPIALSLPQQGGHVLFAGAVVKNLRKDTVIVRGRLREKDTDVVVAEEARTVVMQPVPGDPDSMQSDVRTNSQVSNIAVCPNYLPHAIDGETYVLEIVVTELYVDAPRSVSARRAVVPTCAKGTPDSVLCACECAASYALGKCPPSKG